MNKFIHIKITITDINSNDDDDDDDDDEEDDGDDDDDDDDDIYIDIIHFSLVVTAGVTGGVVEDIVSTHGVVAWHTVTFLVTSCC